MDKASNNSSGLICYGMSMVAILKILLSLY